MAASNLNLGKAPGGVLNIQPADGTTTTNLVLPAINGTVVAADSNGNVGIGVTPSAWHTSVKAIDYFATLTKELQDEFILKRSEARDFIRAKS